MARARHSAATIATRFQRFVAHAASAGRPSYLGRQSGPRLPALSRQTVCADRQL